MTRKKTVTALSCLSMGVLVGLALAVVLLCQGPSTGQGETRPRARTLMKTALDHFKRGDYESAANDYALAQAARNELTPTEKKDLDVLIHSNNVALQGRMEGAAQVRQADLYLQNNQPIEANNLVKALIANQYLSPADRQTLDRLNEQLRASAPKGASWFPMLGEKGAKGDYKSLLRDAREALKSGDFETAEKLIILAEKAGPTFPWLHPFGDNPTKVRRDIQVAKSKLQRAPVIVNKEPPENQSPEKKDFNPLSAVKGLFQKQPKEAPKPPEKGANVSGSSPINNDGPQLTPAPAPKGPEKGAKAEPSFFERVGQNLPWPLGTGKETPKKDEKSPIQRVSHDGPALPNPNSPPVPAGPVLPGDPIKAVDIGGPVLPGGPTAPPDPSGPIVPPIPPLPEKSGLNLQFRPAQPTSQNPAVDPKANSAAARQIIRKGYKALLDNDLNSARKLADEAKGMRPQLEWWEDNPDRLLTEIQRREKTKSTTVALPLKLPPAPKEKTASSPQDPRGLLRQARKLLDKIDQAEKLCAQVAAMEEARWGLFEDSPNRLRTDIQKVRSSRDRDESARLLVEARRLIKENQFDDARKLAWKAQDLHGPYTVWDLGDRPTRVLAEADRAEGKPSKGAILPEDNPAKSNATALADPSKASAPNQVSARQRALSLLAEARTLEKQGNLLQARQKAVEAKQLEVNFAPQEDSPEQCLLSLAALCDRQVQAMIQQAQDHVLLQQADPTRFQKAAQALNAAHGLAKAFGQDTQRLDQKWAWIEQVRITGNTGPVAQAPPPPTEDPNRQTGLEKLEKARLELQAGNRLLARRLAEDAFNPKYGIQDFASQVLRTIDAEDHYHAMNQANRTADAGIDAFQRGDFRKAQGLFAALDPKILTSDRQVRLRDIMAMPEMQPGNLTKVAALFPGKEPAMPPNPGVGQAQVGDLPKSVIPAPPAEVGRPANPPHGADVGLMDHFKAMEEVHFQQLREHALAVQNSAINLYRSGEANRAIEVLKDYLDQLSRSQLEPTRVEALRRQVEARMQQFRTLQAQAELDKEGQALLNANAGNSEQTRNKALRSQQEEVAKLIKQYNAFYKEGNYEQALVQAKLAQDLDRDNLAANAAVHMSAMKVNEKKFKESKARQGQFVVEGLNEDPGPYVDYGKVHFDPAAAARAKNRESHKYGYGPTKSPEVRAIERKLEEPISLQFKDTPLHQVISDLRALSGLNVVPDKQALQNASIALDHPLSLTVDNLKLKSALNLLLHDANLTYVIKETVIYITTEEHAQGKLELKTHPVGDLVIPVLDQPLPTVYSMQDALARHIAGQSGGTSLGPTPYTPPLGLTNGQPVSSANSGSGLAQPGAVGGQNGPQSSVSKGMPGQTIEKLLIDLIQNTVAPKSWDPIGPGKIQYFPMGMALVINQTQDVQEQINDLLIALRRLQDLEVAIEMRLVAVSEQFFERLGVDFDINLRTKNSKYESQLLSGQFQPFGQINQFTPSTFVSGLTPAGTYTPDLNIPIRFSSFDFNLPPFGGYPGTFGADGGLFMGLAFLSDIQVFMLLEAAQGDTRSNIMQAPKITVFNGQTAFIQVQESQFYITGITPTFAGAQVFFTPQNTLVPIGITMQVTPVVSADRRFVRLNLTPSITSQPTAITNVPLQIAVPQLFQGPGGATTTGAQPVIMQMFLQQPTLSTISLSTTVNVPDGGTVLLGGLKFLAEARNEFGPPILSKIPYISRLVRNIGYGRETRSTMILVTPRIIITEEEEQMFRGEIAPIPR